MPPHGPLPPNPNANANANARKRPRAAVAVADQEPASASANGSSNSSTGSKNRFGFGFGLDLGFGVGLGQLAPLTSAKKVFTHICDTTLTLFGAEPIGATAASSASAASNLPSSSQHSSAHPGPSSSARHSSPTSVSVSVSRTSQPPTARFQFQARDLHATPRGFLVSDLGVTPRQADHIEHSLYPSIHDHEHEHDRAGSVTLVDDEEPPTKRARLLGSTAPSFSMSSAASSALSSSAATSSSSAPTRQSRASWAINLPTSSSSSSFSYSSTLGYQGNDRQSRRTTLSVPDSHVMHLASAGSSLPMPPPRPRHSRQSDNPKLNVNAAVQRARHVMSPIPSSLASASSSTSSHQQQPTSIIDLTLASSTSTDSSRSQSRASHAARSSHSSTTSAAAASRSWRSTPVDTALSKLYQSSKFQRLTAQDVDLMYRLRHLRDTVHTPVATTPESEIYARLRAQEEQVEREIQRLALAQAAAKAAAPPAPKRSVDMWDLTPDMEQRVADALEYALDPANEEVALVDHVNNALIGKDFATLKPKTWLNDEIVNTYGVMLTKRALAAPEGTLPKIRIFQSFFYSRFRDEGYARVKSWTRGKKRLLGVADLLVFPIHGGAHWTVGCINFKKKRIEYYDSLHGPDSGFFKRMRMYLREEARDKLGEEFDFEGWIDYYPINDIPLQLNSYDCGVFTCAFMEHVTREAELKDAFDQTHLVKWRKRVFYELLSKEMLT